MSLADPSTLTKACDDYFNPLVSSGHLKAAACVVVESENSSIVRLYGPVTLETYWRVASISKPFTALAVMQLVERGQIQLDADINRYLKHIHVDEPFAKPITIREVLQHRSGLDDYFVGDGFLKGLQPSISEIMEKRTLHPVYPPNSVEFYSNYGYGLLGAVIEDVTGQRFEDYMQSNVLQPMGMANSTFVQPLQDPSHMAPASWFYQRASPASGLTTNATDMLQFLASVLEENKSVVSSHSFEEMTPRQPASIRLQHELGYWSGADRGRHLVGASGDSGSFHSVLMAFPDQHIGYFTLVSGGGNSIAWDFYERFAKAEFGSTSQSPAPQDRGQIMTQAQLLRFAGLYRTVRYPHRDLSKTFILMNLTRVSVTEDGALSIWGARWLPTGPLRFRKQGAADVVSFSADGAGRIRFFNDSQERISWYETGYASIAFYFLFVALFVLVLIRGTGLTRYFSAVALLHCLGWIAICLAIGPSNLIFGLPLALKANLAIGTLLPALAAGALFSAWRQGSRTAYVVAASIIGYIPFVWYWNLKL